MLTLCGSLVGTWSMGFQMSRGRFRSSVESSIKLALSRPKAGAPKPVRNSVLGDLRSWPVKGFDEFRIYYLARQDTLTVVRVLHDKRDIGAILEKQAIDDPSAD